MSVGPGGLNLLKDLLLHYPIFDFKEVDAAVNSLEETFFQARETGADYFLVLEYEEKPRSVLAKCRLYLARTGALLKDFSVFRTGNNRVRDTFYSLSGQIKDSFPLGGTILARQFDRGIINLGTIESIEEGDEFLIIKKGCPQATP